MSVFYGVEIWDSTNPTKPYYTDIDIKHDINNVFKVIVNEPVNNKYPTVIYPNKTNYLKGSATGNYLYSKGNQCDIQFDNEIYKVKFTEWLSNKRTKYLKLADDMIIPVAITSVSWEIDKAVTEGDGVKINFEWVQIGDFYSSTDSHIQCTVCNATLVPNASYCHFCGTQIGVSE